MAKDFKFIYKGWAWGWGIFLLLIAALVLVNQFGGFITLGFWSIAVAALAVAFLIKCIVDLSFGSLPIPIAALYYIFQTPLELPEISFWPLVLVTLLATAGLHALIPNRRFRKFRKQKRDKDWEKNKYRKKYGGRDVVVEIIEDVGDAVVEASGDIADAVEGIADDVDGTVIINGETDGKNEKTRVEEGGEENNPQISVQFGSISRYLRANSLETVDLDCKFGALEVYFDDVTLSPNGAEAYLNCQFGAIELYVPSHWRIIDNLSVTLAGVEIKGKKRNQDENAPVLTVSGNVAFGAAEVHRI